MRAAHRKCLIAAAVCLIATPAFSQDHQQEPPRTQQQPAAQQQTTDQTLLVIEIKQPAQAQNKPEANTPERPEQRSNGWFAGWSLSDRIAGIASAAAFLQFIALVITIWVMVRNGRRQLRAYVFPRDASIFEGMMLDTPLPAHTNEIGIILNFQNYGQTPAYKVVSWAQIEVAEQAREANLVAPKLEQKFHTSIGVNGVMPKIMWHGRALTQIEIDDVNKQARAIYLYGRLEYRDAFKKRRYCNFRLRYNGPFPPPKGVIFFHCEHGNDAN